MFNGLFLLNVVWPALYVSENLLHFWYLILVTVLIEALILKRFFEITTKQAFLYSIIGNIISGVAGTYILAFPMIAWHYAFDEVIPGATFGAINWIATYILMFLGSVLIETLAIKLISKKKFKELILPLSIGNLLTYIFIIVYTYYM